MFHFNDNSNIEFYSSLISLLTDIIGSKLCKAWEKELELGKKKKRKPSLIRAGLRVFGWDLFGLGMLLLSSEMFFR